MPRCDPNVAAGVKQQRGHDAVAAAERSSTSTSNVILTYGQRRASAMVTTWGSGRMGRPGLVPAPSAASARTQRCMHLDHEVRYRAQGSSLWGQVAEPSASREKECQLRQSEGLYRQRSSLAVSQAGLTARRG